MATAMGAIAPQVDGYDTVFFLGLALLFAGLTVWLGVGVALTASGGIVILLGLAAAARAATPKPAGDEPAPEPGG